MHCRHIVHDTKLSTQIRVKIFCWSPYKFPGDTTDAALLEFWWFRYNWEISHGFTVTRCRFVALVQPTFSVPCTGLCRDRLCELWYTWRYIRNSNEKVIMKEFYNCNNTQRLTCHNLIARKLIVRMSTKENRTGAQKQKWNKFQRPSPNFHDFKRILNMLKQRGLTYLNF